jgi:acetyltransferase-like isoleucine patch superfamily enzyme
MSLTNKLKLVRAWLIRKTSRTRIRGLRGNRVILNDARLYGCQIDFIGEGNTVEIGPGAILHQSQITLVGRENRFSIGAHTRIRAGGVFVVEDSGSQIAIGDHTTMTSPMLICGEGGRIEIGEDCMIAMGTCIRNSDGHAIFDTTNGLRINQAADVIIANHVWLGIRSLILKGANIGAGSIIGANSIVTGPIPAASLAVGSPARVIRQNVAWTRERTDRNEDAPTAEMGLPASADPSASA